MLRLAPNGNTDGAPIRVGGLLTSLGYAATHCTILSPRTPVTSSQTRATHGSSTQEVRRTHGPAGSLLRRGPCFSGHRRIERPPEAAPATGLVSEMHDDNALLERLGSGDVAAAGVLYDRYGAAMYTFALTVTRSPAAAAAAVLEVFRTAAATSAPGRAWQRLAHATLAACPPSEEPEVLSRSLLALTLYGSHTYREAAVLLGIDSDEAAQRLRETLSDPFAPQ